LPQFNISLAFAEARGRHFAKVKGRLSRGFGVTRLVDLPIAWSDQWQVLGLSEPTST
jgi:hypothetical protein